MAQQRNKHIYSVVDQLNNLHPKYGPSGIFLVDKSPFHEKEHTENTVIGRILPQSDIYNQAAFQIEMKLIDTFPLKPPEVRFLTPIHHPNVGADGKISLNILNPSGTWTPATTLVDVVKQIIDMIDHPQKDHAVNTEVASQFMGDKAAFESKAKAMVKEHGLPRS